MAIIEDHLVSLAEKKDWSTFNKTLALAMFGIILFPFHVNIVDHAAMDAFFAWEVYSQSPIPAILADTLLSVEFCRQRQGKTLRCCTSLLYVWGVTHFYASSHMGVFPDPLRSFSKIPLQHRQALEWKTELENWNIEHVSWVCPWFRPGYILIRCGNYPNIPLLGLRGCIAYSPKIAMRQLMRTQTVPTQEELRGLNLYHYSHNFEEISAVRKAWERPIYLGDKELGRIQVSTSHEYEKWRKNRGVPLPSDAFTKALVNEELQLQVNALNKRIEVMETQLRAFEEKEQESTIIIDGLKRQCKKKDHEIELLKNDYADYQEEARRALKMPRFEQDSLFQDMNDEIARFEKALAEQTKMIKLIQDDLAGTHSEAQRWRETAEKYKKSLDELHDKEKEGLAQYGHLIHERDQIRERSDQQYALIVHLEEKIREACQYSENMSQAIHEQAKILGNHVRIAEDELQRKPKLPIGFFKLFRFCQHLLQSIV